MVSEHFQHCMRLLLAKWCSWLVIGPPYTGGVSVPPVLSVWNFPPSSVRLQGKTRNQNAEVGEYWGENVAFTTTTLCLSISGLAVSTSSELLRLQANREKCLHCVHAGCVGRLSGPQRARTASPGMETLLQVRTMCVFLCVCVWIL